MCDEETVAVSDRQTKIQNRKTKSKSNAQRVKTNLACTSPFPILNEFLSFQRTKFETMLSIVLCEAVFKFSYMFFFKIFARSTPDSHEISEMTTHAS